MARSTTTRLTSQSKKAASDGAAGAKATAIPMPNADATPDQDDTADAAVANPGLRKKEFIERVALASGVKKQTVKSVIEAALAELGNALTNGEEAVLPPLGKIKVVRSKPVPNGEMLVLRLRRSNAQKATAETPDDDNDPLEVAAE